MKKNRNIFVGFGLGALIAGAFSFLYMPFMVKNDSFLLGFVACLGFVLFALLSMFIWNRKSLFTNHPATEGSGNAARATALKRIWVSAFILGVGLLCILLLFNHNQGLKSTRRYLDLQSALERERIESAKKSSLAHLMAMVLVKVEDELKQNPKRTLSDETITRIAVTCYFFKPYAQAEEDTSSAKKVSPERGQLLLMLSGMNVDSGALHKILSQASFSGAALRGADLRGADLRGCDLSEADLFGANLEGADLSGANLMLTHLWGANLNRANLGGVNAKRADLRWAELNGVDLTQADLHEADLSSAKLRKADLQGAILQWTDFNGAFLNEANLTGTDMFRAGLKRAQLSGAIFIDAKLTLANLSEANLTGANFTHTHMSDVVVSEHNWLMRLNEWQVTGAKEIQDQYKMVDELSTGQHLYQLKKINH